MSIYVDALVEAFKKHRCRCYWKGQQMQIERDFGQATFHFEIGDSRSEDKESALDFLARLIREDHTYTINYAFKEFFGSAWDDVKMAAEDGIHPFDDF